MSVKLPNLHLPLLLSWLEQHLPCSFKLYQELKNCLRDKLPEVEFFVDKWPNPEAAMALMNPAAESLFTKNLVMGVYGTSEVALAALIQDEAVVGWRKGLMFCAVPDNLWHVIQGVAEGKGGTVSIGNVLLLEAKSQDLNPIPVPKGMKMSSISDNDIDIVNSTWKFAAEGSVSFLQEQIDGNPSAFLTTEKGEHVGHMVGYNYGTMGILYVCPQFRRRGYAKVIISQMAQKYFERGDDAYVFIEADNPPSLSLHQSLGFRIVPNLKLSWMTFLPKHSCECVSRKCCV